MQPFNLPKCVVAALLIEKEIFNMLFYCKSGINQYAGQKTLTDVFRAVLPYHLGMLLHVFIKR